MLDLCVVPVELWVALVEWRDARTTEANLRLRSAVKGGSNGTWADYEKSKTATKEAEALVHRLIDVHEGELR